MNRLSRSTVLLIASLVLASCGGAAAPASPPTATSEPTPIPTVTTPPAGTAPPSEDPVEQSPAPDATDRDVAALVGALDAAGADVRVTGPFATEPVGGEGVGLCVDGQTVNVYVFPTADDSKAVADRIDPDDPSNLGTSMVSWIGAPRFWRAERLLVLYLGDDPAVESGLTSILGAPFARGEGGALPGDPGKC